MALNTVPIIPRDGTITVTDGAALSYTVAYEDGDLSVSGLRAGQMSTEIFRDRGIMYSFRQIQEEPVSLSFSAHATEIADGTEQTFLDVFNKTGAWSAATSQLANSGDVHAVTVTFTGDTSGDGTGGEAGQTIVITYFIPEDSSFSEGVPGKFSVSGSGVLLASAGISRT